MADFNEFKKKYDQNRSEYLAAAALAAVEKGTAIEQEYLAVRQQVGSELRFATLNEMTGGAGFAKYEQQGYELLAHRMSIPATDNKQMTYGILTPAEYAAVREFRLREINQRNDIIKEYAASWRRFLNENKADTRRHLQQLKNEGKPLSFSQIKTEQENRFLKKAESRNNKEAVESLKCIRYARESQQYKCDQALRSTFREYELRHQKFEQTALRDIKASNERQALKNERTSYLDIKVSSDNIEKLQEKTLFQKLRETNKESNENKKYKSITRQVDSLTVMNARIKNESYDPDFAMRIHAQNARMIALGKREATPKEIEGLYHQYNVLKESCAKNGRDFNQCMQRSNYAMSSEEIEKYENVPLKKTQFITEKDYETVKQRAEKQTVAVQERFTKFLSGELNQQKDIKVEQAQKKTEMENSAAEKLENKESVENKAKTEIKLPDHKQATQHSVKNEARENKVPRSVEDIVAIGKAAKSAQQTKSETAEVKTEKSAQQNKIESTEVKVDKSAQQNKVESTEVKTEKLAQQTKVESAEVKSEKSAQQTKVESAEVKSEKSAQQTKAELAEVKADKSAQQTKVESPEIKADKSAQQNKVESAEVKSEKSAQQTKAELAEVKADKSAQQNEVEPAKVKADKSAQQNEVEPAKVKSEKSVQQNKVESAEVKAEKSAQQTKAELAEVKADKSAQQNKVEPAKVKAEKSVQQNKVESAEVKAEKSAEVKIETTSQKYKRITQQNQQPQQAQVKRRSRGVRV